MATQQATPVILYVRPDDAASQAARRYLDERGVDYTLRDVTVDPSASAVLFGRLGRIAVPALQIGERLLVGYDPVQYARLLPRDPSDEERVAFGAGVRAVPPEIAAAAGLPGPFGVEVGPVKEGSPAAAAGIATGDIITAIGPYTITGGPAQFSTAVSARRPGDTMTLAVWHDGTSRHVDVRFPAPDTQGSDGDA